MEKHRFKNALNIIDGACNPIAICNAIIQGCREVNSEGNSGLNDPAIRLMVYQLNFIAKATEIFDHGSINAFGDAMDFCRSKLMEEKDDKRNH